MPGGRPHNPRKKVVYTLRICPDVLARMRAYRTQVGSSFAFQVEDAMRIWLDVREAHVRRLVEEAQQAARASLDAELEAMRQ